MEPTSQSMHCINRKGYFSMVLQSLVNHHGQFLDIFIGWSGRAHDARIFKNFSLYHNLEAGTLFPQRDFLMGDVQMPLCIVRDMAYPLMPWLMKPYTGHLHPSREQFNAYLNRAQMQVECTFECFKEWFRCLLTHLNVGEHNIPEVVTVCCILHNIVENKGEAFLLGQRASEQPRSAAIHQAHQVLLRGPEGESL
uniref:DDE Tnp4 domain-containing protein n=1 Tax=Pelodiscus sinensis TaxID=13735 RepID=K7EYU5_PELSI